jgi:hypothetical protein
MVILLSSFSRDYIKIADYSSEKQEDSWEN